jgi:membrane fusion protein, multidrug efflux system
MKNFESRKILENIKKVHPKSIFQKVSSYDYKGLLRAIKGFNFKSPDAYKHLLKDPVFRKILIFFLVMIVVVTMFRGYVFRKKQTPVTPVLVETALAIKKDVPIYLKTFGSLQAVEDIDIKAQVTGKIDQVHFKNGDDISIRQLLYTIEPGEYDALAGKARASLAQSLAELKLKTDIVDRNKKLVEKDLISKQEFESLQTELVEAQAKVDMNQAALALAEIDLNYCFIKSPIKGVAGKNLLDAGNIIVADDGPVLVNIKNIDNLYVDFTLSEKELARVRGAMQRGSLIVELVPEEGDDAHEGRLVFIDNTVNNMTGTISLRAVVDNTERALWPGQFVLIKLVLETQKDAVLIPYAGVKIGQKGHYAFVFNDNDKADLRQVEIGVRQGDLVVVEKGISADEKVVVSGMLGLYPGAAVIETKTLEMQAKKT